MIFSTDHADKRGRKNRRIPVLRQAAHSADKNDSANFAPAGFTVMAQLSADCGADLQVRGAMTAGRETGTTNPHPGAPGNRTPKNADQPAPNVPFCARRRVRRIKTIRRFFVNRLIYGDHLPALEALEEGISRALPVHFPRRILGRGSGCADPIPRIGHRQPCIIRFDVSRGVNTRWPSGARAATANVAIVCIGRVNHGTICRTGG